MQKMLWYLALTMLFIQYGCVPPATESNCQSVTGTVLKISEGGEKDVVIQLEGTDKIYYINRGLESGLDLEDLNERLVGKEVLLKYPEYWSPLDPTGSTKHLARVECEGQTIYSEMKE